jgi:hypothetical protein
MGFTVTGPEGTKDAEFEAYARLLRQHGKHLGNLPRVPDPTESEAALGPPATLSSRRRRGTTSGRYEET